MTDSTPTYDDLQAAFAVASSFTQDLMALSGRGENIVAAMALAATEEEGETLKSFLGPLQTKITLPVQVDDSESLFAQMFNKSAEIRTLVTTTIQGAEALAEKFLKVAEVNPSYIAGIKTNYRFPAGIDENAAGSLRRCNLPNLLKLYGYNA